MKIAAEHAPTTQRRRAVEACGRSTAMDDSGTKESAGVSARQHSANRPPKRLTDRADSACLRCAKGMTMPQIEMAELAARARDLVPILRARAIETEKLR